MPRLAAALLAGAIAICINTALLAGCDAMGFVTARGGLLRLVRDIAGRMAPSLGLTDFWAHTLAPATTGPTFQTGFHIFVGLLMALFYAFLLEQSLPGRAWAKGVIYAIVLWLLNAFVVLPLTGEGIAGSNHLGVLNMMGFAAIHTIFFVLLSILYGRFRTPQ